MLFAQEVSLLSTPTNTLSQTRSAKHQDASTSGMIDIGKNELHISVLKETTSAWLRLERLADNGGCSDGIGGDGRIGVFKVLGSNIYCYIVLMFHVFCSHVVFT